MRLHRLHITAFGPFPGTEQVDFDRLGEAGLFLLTGPTGAGKTSILDAVTFALYGQVPGFRQHTRSFRSDHAAADTAPAVVLEVTVRGRRLRITRTPAWDRPKRRGSGTVHEQARVLLEELGSEGTRTLATRLDEAGQLIGRLLGLTASQFCQVALLPQGQFAEFLRADADKRRDLLESLFDTGRFGTVENWLVERRRETKGSLDEVDQRLRQVMARVAEAAEWELPPDLPPENVTDALGRLLATARTSLDRAAEAAASATETAEAASSALIAGRQVAELQDRRATLQRRRELLRARQPDLDAAVAELAAARTVAPLLPLLAEMDRLESELGQVRARAVAAHLVLADALPVTGTETGASPAPVLPAVELVTGTARATRDELGRLTHLVSQERETDDMLATADELERRVVQAEAEGAKVATWLAEAGPSRALLTSARTAATAAAADLPLERTAHRDAVARFEAAVRRDRLAAQVSSERDRLRVLTDVQQRARATEQELRRHRLDGMAAELASRLMTGADCPVCGSDVHPRPAVATGPSVTHEQEEQAARRADQAEVDRRAAASVLAALEVELAEQRSRAGGDEAADDLRRAAAEHQRTADDLERVAATRHDAEEAVLAFDRQHEAHVREQVRLAQEARSTRARVSDLQARVDTHRSVLDSARGADLSIASRVARLDRLADALDGLARQLDQVDHLGRAATEAQRRAQRSASSRGWGSLEAVTAAAREESRLSELEEFRHRHDSALAAVEQQLAEPSLSAAAETPMPDLLELAEAERTAVLARTAAGAALARARDRLCSLERLAAAAADILAGRLALDDAHRVVDGLSRLAEGKSPDNRLRMSLSGYVLAARLEQVAASASERLLRMSSGRFSLLHSVQPPGARSRGGLGLRVLDAWTGVERDPSTLSGGEAFAASLALALGLADVVTAEAGGTLLETLFVDEGFGSLDDETLEEVMAVLDGLRDGGRTVGIVSHVADLRQRVPVQLRVEKSRSGSRIHQ